MKRFNQDWYFLKTEFGTELSDVKGRISEFKQVDLPHDWLIYNNEDLYETGTGWYTKTVDKSELLEADEKRAVIVFDGVYMDCTLYVNETDVGDWKYGYSTFSFDITDALKEGENRLMMQVRHRSPNTRWYSGAGIYRDVYIHGYKESYIPLDGVYFHTVKEDADHYAIEIDCECEGVLSSECVARASLYEKEACVKVLAEASAAGKALIHAKISLSEDKIKEWSLKNPNCYTLVVELLDENKNVLDKQCVQVGFRDIQFKTDSGLWLNGENVKVHGVCEHHDLGCLGSAFYKDAMRRKFEILRAMGVNGLRTSHNMPAREVMELADEMGFLVVSEAFDMWERPKTDYDYARFFVEWADKDVRAWVRRDRNHPSLLLWSIGNEIYDTHADAHGEEITKRLLNDVRESDYKTNAAVTIGSNYMAWEGAQNCAEIVGFAGYNYGEKYYNEHHEVHSDWYIYGSETASTVQSRGVYKFPHKQSLLSDDDEQCSALGNSRTSWGARSSEGCIIDDRDAKFAFGQFIWTGFDYIGEPTPYHTRNSYFGQIDTAGFPKDSYYIYQAEWSDAKVAPMVHVFPYWNFNEGQQIDVRIASNLPTVELLVNGKSLGKRDIDHEKGEELVPTWNVPYEKGEITAIAYDENGVEVARETRKSFSDAVELRITSDKAELSATGRNLAFLTIEALDENGNVVENAMDYVELSVSGEGRLLGMDNGDSTDNDSYKTNVRKMFNGKLLAVIGSTTKAGTITVEGKAKNLKSAVITIPIKEAETEQGVCATEDCRNTAKLEDMTDSPRQIELKVTGSTTLTKEAPALEVEAVVYPKYNPSTTLQWRVVNVKGIEIKSVLVEPLSDTKVRITAQGDGEYYIRCMAKNEKGKVCVISQLECKAVGIGSAFTNPYEMVIAGLFTRAYGDIGNGNDKGVATEWNSPSGPIFDNVDFGDFGSDEITLPLFTFSDSPVNLEIWQGVPGEEQAELVTTVVYTKKPIWNVYQEETFKLPRRITGVQTITFVLREKIHIQGFVFTKQEKAYSKLYAAGCGQIYGDSFVKEETAITGIGNNVTIGFDDMDFGEEGANTITLWSRSVLAANTVHIHFTDESGQVQARILEVTGQEEYASQTIDIEPLTGKGKLEFIFLPGTKMDLEAIQFNR